MKLYKLCIIDKLLCVVIWFIMLPFLFCGLLLNIMSHPFKFVVDLLDCMRFRIGNYLLRISDEVSEGAIRNEYMISHCTAIEAYGRYRLEMDRLKG